MILLCSHIDSIAEGKGRPGPMLGRAQGGVQTTIRRLVLLDVHRDGAAMVLGLAEDSTALVGQGWTHHEVGGAVRDVIILIGQLVVVRPASLPWSGIG